MEEQTNIRPEKMTPYEIETTNSCPVCGGEEIHTQGKCPTCYSCGWSTCSL